MLEQYGFTSEHERSVAERLAKIDHEQLAVTFTGFIFALHEKGGLSKEGIEWYMDKIMEATGVEPK